MTWQRTSLYILAILSLIALLVFSLFEPVRVSSANWDKTFDYNSKEPYGAWMFRQLLDEYYGPDNIHNCLRGCKFSDWVDNDTTYTYLLLANELYLNEEQLDSILSMVERGHKAMIITQHFMPDDSLGLPYDIYTYKDSIRSLQLDFNEGSIDYFSYTHSIDSTSYDWISTVMIDSISNSLFSSSHLDTVGRSDITGTRRPIYGPLDTLVSFGDSSVIFVDIPYGDGHLYLHSMPGLFSNVMFKMQDGASHFELVMKELESDVLIIGKNYDYGVFNENRASNPIQFIFSSESLAWAYYLLFLTLILYVIFRGKRTQRMMRTLTPNVNSSLEFVDTLSQLYRSQNQPTKLVSHIEGVFYQYFKRNYYLNKADRNFVQKASLKSKVPEAEIKLLLKKMSAARDNPRFREEQLVNLNKSLEDFYKKCK